MRINKYLDQNAYYSGKNSKYFAKSADLLRKYVKHPLTTLSEINQKLANPLFPPCQKQSEIA